MAWGFGCEAHAASGSVGVVVWVGVFEGLGARGGVGEGRFGEEGLQEVLGGGFEVEVRVGSEERVFGIWIWVWVWVRVWVWVFGG